MQVMTNHKWFDDDVEYVQLGGRDDIREIGIKDNKTALLVSKKDAIALAKEFGLVVYENDSNL